MADEALTASFRALVQQHRKPTFMAAYRVLMDWDEARDVTQEAFLALAQQVPAVPEQKLRRWLKTVATNKAIDRRRRRQRAPVSTEEPHEDRASSKEPEPWTVAATDELAQLTRKAMTLLPERQRQVLTMRVLQGRSFVELSRELGISDGAAKTHFRRGLDTLAQLLRNLRDNDT